jgi:hypothetical protein
MSIKDALALKDATLELSFGAVTLRRPSAADVIEATNVASTDASRLYAHLVWRHLVEEGKPVFGSIDEVLAADGVRVLEIGKAAERLYGEGRD